MDRKKATTPIAQYHLEPQTGTTFTVQRDQHIRIIDAEGEQVADLTCFARRDTDEYI